MNMTEDLPAAIRDLSTSELQVMTRDAYSRACQAAETRPRLAAFQHALMVALAEESDRREDVWQDISDDLDDDDAEGEMVTYDGT